MLKHRPRDLALAHDDGGRSKLAEMGHLGIEVGAGNDLDRRVRRARLLDDLTRLERVRNGQQQQPRVRDVGRCQNSRVRSVSDQHLGSTVL